MGYNILIFIVGGCAGYVVSSIASSYKRKKMLKTFIEASQKIVDTIIEKIGDEESDESVEEKEDNVIDILK